MKKGQKHPETRKGVKVVVTGREKVGEGIIRKMGTQGKIATKLKPVEEKGTQKKNK